MRFYKIDENTYINIDKIICIQEASFTYPNQSTIVYFDNGNAINKNYFIITDKLINVLNMFENLKK